MNIGVFVDRGLDDEWKTFIDQLFAVSPPWLRAPESFLLQNIVSAETRRGAWPTDLDIQRGEFTEAEILTVYEESELGEGNPNSISVEQSPGSCLFVISVLVSQVVEAGVALFERWLLNLALSTQEIDSVFLAAGEELDLDQGQGGRADVLRAASRNSTQAIWIVSERDLLPPDLQDFITMGVTGNVVLLRHRDAMLQLGLEQ